MTGFNLLPLLPIFVGAMFVVIAVSYLARKDLEDEPCCRDCRHYLRGKDAALCLHDGCIVNPETKACIDFQHPKP